jgi:hypothetical protein
LNGKSEAEKILLTSTEMTAPSPFVSDGAVIFYGTFSPLLLLLEIVSLDIFLAVTYKIKD